VSSENRAFSERASTLLVWLAKNSYTWTTRAFRIPGEQDGVRGLQVTGSRPFFFMHEGKFYWAQVFERGLDMGVSYTVRVSTFGRNNKMEQLNDFLVSIGVFQSVAKDTVEVTTYRNSGHYMSPSFSAQPKRDLESVFIPGNSKELLCKEFETFISNRSWRLEHSRPDKRCVMLEGPPGTGKSSLALALASHYATLMGRECSKRQLRLLIKVSNSLHSNSLELPGMKTDSRSRFGCAEKEGDM
jgi:hypothetical protein